MQTEPGEAPSNAPTDGAPGTAIGGSPPSLSATLRSGVAWWGLGNLVSRLVRVAVHVVLAWTLDPTDYGIVAMCAAFLVVLQVLADFGVGISIIQKRDATEVYLSSAFWLNIIISLGLAALAGLGAPLLAGFYGEPRVTLVMRVTAVGLLVMALRIVPMALLRKRMQFALYAAIESLSNGLSGCLAIVLALSGAGYWSLVLPALVMGTVIAPVWCRAAKWRPVLRVEWLVLRQVFGYSKFVLSTSLLSLVMAHAGFVLVGHSLGPNRAGIYKFAMENAVFVVENLAWLVGGVAMSGFALQKGDPERLRRSFMRVFEVLVAVTIPLHALLFALAPWLIGGVFPEKWVPAIPYFRILLLFNAAWAPMTHQMGFLFAVDRADVSMKYFLVLTPVTLLAMYFGVEYYGMLGLAWSTTVVRCIGAVALAVWIARACGWQGSSAYVSTSLPYVGAAAAAAFAMWGTAHGLAALGAEKAIVFCSCGALGALLYAVLLLRVAPRHSARVIDDLCPGALRAPVDRILTVCRLHPGPPAVRV